MSKETLISSLKEKGFSEKIVSAFDSVNREDFVPLHWKEHAYDDVALEIGEGQTISQPYTIAFMLSLLELDDMMKVLEIGSGSGYVLALLSEISKNSFIYGVERVKSLYKKSQIILRLYGVKVFCKSGFSGLKKFAPYDRILISAASDKIPEHLLSQLNEGGIIVCPVKNSIFKIKKTSSGVIKREFPGFSFVPLVED